MRENPGEALLAAVKKNTAFMVKMLVAEYKSDVNFVDSDGNTALFWAGWFGNSEIVKFLVDSRAVVSTRNKKNQTPLHWATMKGSVECMELIIKAGGIIFLSTSGW